VCWARDHAYLNLNIVHAGFETGLLSRLVLSGLVRQHLVGKYQVDPILYVSAGPGRRLPSTHVLNV
jgi:hypothetical protein